MLLLVLLVEVASTIPQPNPNAEHKTGAPAKPAGRRVKMVIAFFY
jgi:hypothetical protein